MLILYEAEMTEKEPGEVYGLGRFFTRLLSKAVSWIAFAAFFFPEYQYLEIMVLYLPYKIHCYRYSERFFSPPDVRSGSAFPYAAQPQAGPDGTCRRL